MNRSFITGAVNSNNSSHPLTVKMNYPLKMPVSNANWLNETRHWPFSKKRYILCKTPEMKYVFIEKYQAEFRIKAMSRVLRVACSGWYAWTQRRAGINSRQQFRLSCDSAVHGTFHRAKQRYGAPHLSDELHVQGYHINVKTVAASLRRQGLRAKASRKFSPVSYREHGLPVSENMLKQSFYAHRPNQKWSGDITYLCTY